MGDLLHFPVHRAETARTAPELPPAFFFDVSCPLSYLTAERVERILGEVEWVSVDGAMLRGRPRSDAEQAELRARAEMCARALRLPLVWPDGFPADAPCARRAAAFACELGAGAGAAFALAACRLAFCGGFDLDDPETLAEAAAAAAIPLGACLEAAHEEWRDAELRETARDLRADGIRELPVIRIGDRWLVGESGLTTAGSVLQGSGGISRPLAPVG